MREDQHLGTGSYDPEKYWSARAQSSMGDCYKAVCLFRATRDENRCVDRVQRFLMKSALKHIDLRGRKVLEYGCGAGRWIPFFERYHCVWSGVDISDDMLRIAKDRYKCADLKKITGGHIPSPDMNFDMVYSVAVIHHNPYEQQEKIISEMVRVLRNNGHLILLEGIGNASQSFNMFPRNRKAWTDMVEKHGMVCLSQQGTRYWILRDFASVVKRRLRKITGRETALPESTGLNLDNRISRWRECVGRLDSLIDPYLFPLLPRKYHSAALMVFQKVHEGKRVQDGQKTEQNS